MEIKITTQEIKKVSLLSKFTLILFGVFLTSMIFAIGIKISESFGLWLALGFCIILIFCGFYYIEKGTRLRLITWSMLITIIVGTAGFIIALNFLEKSLGEIFLNLN